MSAKGMLAALAIAALSALVGVGTAVIGSASRDAAAPLGPRAQNDARERAGSEAGESANVAPDRGFALAFAAGSDEAGDDEASEAATEFDAHAGDDLGATRRAIETSRRMSTRAYVRPDARPSREELDARVASARVAAAMLCRDSGSECRSNADCCSGLACAGGVAGYGTAGHCVAAR